MAGKLVHFEIPVDDTGGAKDFWSGVFGWEFGDSAMPEMEYYMVRTGDDQGGAVTTPKGPGIVVYFDTDDIDASIAKVRENGGTADDRMAIPHVGWFTHCKDPEGTDFSLFQSDETVTG